MAFLIRGGLILAIVCHSTWAYAAPFPQGKPNIFFSKKYQRQKYQFRFFSGVNFREIAPLISPNCDKWKAIQIDTTTTEI